MAAGETRPNLLFTWNELSLNGRGGPKLLPTLPLASTARKDRLLLLPKGPGGSFQSQAANSISLRRFDMRKSRACPVSPAAAGFWPAQNRCVASRSACSFCRCKPHATNAAPAAIGSCLMPKAVLANAIGPGDGPEARRRGLSGRARTPALAPLHPLRPTGPAHPHRVPKAPAKLNPEGVA